MKYAHNGADPGRFLLVRSLYRYFHDELFRLHAGERHVTPRRRVFLSVRRHGHLVRLRDAGKTSEAHSFFVLCLTSYSCNETALLPSSLMKESRNFNLLRLFICLHQKVDDVNGAPNLARARAKHVAAAFLSGFSFILPCLNPCGRSRPT